MRNLLFFSLLLIFVISYFSSKMKSHASTLHLILPWAAYDDEKEGVCQETRSAAAIPKNNNSSSSIQKQEDKKKKRYHHHRQSAFKRCLEPQAEWACALLIWVSNSARSWIQRSRVYYLYAYGASGVLMELKRESSRCCWRR